MNIDKLLHVFEVERELNKINDADVLLESILTVARKIVNADAGSIYECEGDTLRICHAQNDTQYKNLKKGEKLPFVSFSFPVSEKSISGFAALSGDIINIEDVYDISPDESYSFNKDMDIKSGYRTKSMLTVPLKNTDNKEIGVIQVINALDADGNIIPFDKEAEFYIDHFAGAATQALEKAYLTRSMILRMTEMTRLRDPKETGGHVERVTHYSLELYDLWAVRHDVDPVFSQKFRDSLAISARLHDVGKVAISDMILKKAAALTDDEYHIMQDHCRLGYNLFSGENSQVDLMAKDVSLRHHEKWNGTGYPGYIDFETGDALILNPETNLAQGLTGEEIPLSARIVALADVFDALSSIRSYKKAWTDEEVVNEIKSQSGKHFDPELVEIFLLVYPRICAIRDAFSDQ